MRAFHKVTWHRGEEALAAVAAAQGKVVAVDQTPVGEIHKVLFPNQAEATKYVQQAQERNMRAEAERQAKAASPGTADWVASQAYRTPLHLLPPSVAFTAVPSAPERREDAETIAEAWAARPLGCDAIDFVFYLPTVGVDQNWERYLRSEQDYMDAWAPLMAERASTPTVKTPEAEAMGAAIDEAFDAFRLAYDEQRRVSDDSLSAYSQLRLTKNSLTVALAKQACSERPHLRYCRDCFGDSYLVMADGDLNLTCCAAGYTAAAQILRSYGVGCAPWAQWD